MDKSNLLKSIPIIAIIRGVKPDEAVEVAITMYECGIRCIEVPLNSPSPYQSINKIVEVMGDKMLVGAGTVISKEQVSQVKEAGGELIVSPNTNTELISYSKELGMLSYPGVMTVSESFEAISAGADGLKLFPANVSGTEFVKAAKVVLPRDTPLFAVGGINSQNMQEWLEAGIDGFGLGNSIYKPGMSIEEISKNCQKAVLKMREFQNV